MSLRKVLSAVCVALLSATTLFAYDTQGKFGMGVSMAGTPVLLFSTMKYGVASTLDIEPSVGFHQFSVTSTYYSTQYIGNEIVDIERTSKQKYNLLVLSNSFGIKPIRTDRSNLVIKPGIAYYRASLSEEYTDESEEELEGEEAPDPALWNLSIKAGFGIEHFFTDNFSVYAGFMSLYSIFGSNAESNGDDYVSFMSLGNQFAELSFVWYL